MFPETPQAMNLTAPSPSEETAENPTTVDEEEEHKAYDSDDSIDLRLGSREVHTFNWLKRTAKEQLQEYFDCVPFFIGDDEDIGKYATKDEFAKRKKLPGEKQPRYFNNHKLIEDVYEHGLPRITVSERQRGCFFTIMAGLNASHAMVFPFVMMRFGGWYFLIPFLITTLAFTLPVNFAQYCLGQFTNMPPTVIFHRWAPIFSGVGVLVTVVQYMAASTVRFDHRFVSMALELFYSLIAIRAPYSGQSMIQGSMNGYRPICAPDQIYTENECWPIETGSYRDGKTDREYIREKIRADLHADSFIRKYAIAEAPPIRIFDPVYAHAHFISATTILAIFLFIVSCFMVKTYFSRIQHVVFYGTIVTCTLTMVNVVLNFGTSATILVHVIGSDFGKIFEVKTWIMATIHSMVLFGTVDGSYFGIGSVNKFQNRSAVDLLRAKGLGMVVLLLFSFTFGMTTLAGATMYMSRIQKRSLTVDDYRILIHNDAQVFEFFYVYFFQDMLHKLLLIVYIGLFCLWEMSSLMLMAEGSVGHIYRLFTSTARLPQFLIRYITLIFHCALVMFIHLFLRKYSYVSFQLVPYVVFVQTAAFAMIDYRRLFTIMITLNAKHRPLFYRNRKTIRFYYMALPLVFTCFIIFDIRANGCGMAKRTVVPVILFGLFQLARYRLLFRTKEAWLVSLRFRPFFLMDLDEFVKQENALNGKNDAVHVDTMKEKWEKVMKPTKKKTKRREISQEEKALEMITRKEQRRRK